VLDVASARLPDGTLFQVGKSSEERVEVLARFRRVVLVVLLSTVAVGLAGGALLTHWTLRPLRALAGAVRRNLDTGRLSERVPVRQTGDALDELGTLFNGMLDRIESLIAGMRGSLDNVAHDLRTPMTRLRGLAEAALQGPADVEAYRAALADCVEESERVVAMLTTLMDISEAETGTLRLHREAVEIVPILEETRSLYADLAEDEGVELGVAAPPGLTVDADRNRLRQVLANLVDNAVKYTPSGGRVEMEAHREGAWVRIVVRDTGIGIPLAEQPRVWQRLYRGDESRSERGLGLGLSLVRAVVAAHRGRVELESTPGAGAAFAVWLPAAHAPA
jgi:signal transduction histidine kinase